MADRPNHLPGYPMPQTNFMNPAQQQQSSMAYQQSQSAMNPAQQIPGVTNPENQRLWQQIQDRHRAMGGADGMGQQQLNQQQMADFLRGQAVLSQTQNRQQPSQLQQAQQFANLGGMAQMNAALPGHNPLAAMQRQQQGMQGGGMGGMSNVQLTPQVAQLLSQRNGVSNPAMIQMNRQLGLLNRAQKQQPQNGPANFAIPGPSFSGQQNTSQLPFQAGMFPPKPDDARMPVSQGQQQFPVVPNGLMQGHGVSNDIIQHALRTSDGRPLTLEELRYKILALKRVIETEREALTKASQNPAPEAVLALREKHRELQQREVLFARMVEHLRMINNQRTAAQMQQAGPSTLNNGPGGGVLNPLSFPNASQQQTGQHHTQPNQNWMPQASNANMQNQLTGSGPAGNQQLLNDMSQKGQVQPPQQTTGSPFHPNLVQSQQQQTPVPRSVPTPQQQMLQFLQQNNAQSSPPSSGSSVLPGQGNVGQQGPTLEGQDVHHRVNGLSFPPLARERFGQMLQEWWKRNGIKVDPRMIAIGSRTIDLYQLHTEVLQLGGVVNVRRHDLWNVIAAKMGWTPPTISETGRTQEQITEQFRTVYEQFLESFEVTYMQAAMKQSLTAQPPQSTDNQGPSQPSAGTSQLSAQQMLPQQAMHLARLANLTVEQLRAAGYPDTLIQSIEQNRPALQATWRRMLQRFQLSQQQRQSQQPLPPQMQQPGSALNAQLPFPSQLGTSNTSSSLNIQGAMPGANAPGHPGISASANQSNDVPMQRPQLTAQYLTPQNVSMVGTLANPRKPTMEANKQALLLIEQMKSDIAKDRTVRPEHIKQLSDAEKGAFREPFEAVCSSLRETCRYLHIYLAATNDLQVVRGVLSMLDVCDKQRQLLQSVNPPTFILDVATLQKLMKTCTDVKVKVSQVMQHILAQGDHNQARAPMSQQGDGGLPPPSAPQRGASPQNIAPSPVSMPPRPPTTQPQLPPPHPVQQNLRPPPGKTPQIPPARPPSVSQGKGKIQHATSPNATENAPSPSVSTPLPNGAATSHVQVSPQTPKSPKAKSQPKSRPRQRRQSKAQALANAATVTPSPAAPSITTSGPAASTSTPAAEPAPRPAQGASSTVNPLKRPREEGPSDQGESVPASDLANEETPSKRIKNEWENVPDAEPSRRQAEAEKIKTPEEAAKFYSDMTQLLDLSNNADLPPALHETLAQLAKTVGNGIDIPDTGRNSSVSNFANAGSSSPKPDNGDDFFSFLDFTAFQQDDDKPDTPELLPTSSTNPSPESGAGSETDHPPASMTYTAAGDRAKIVDTSDAELRADFFDTGPDPLRLGIWGEIDGGESGYFSSSDTWKWDGVTSSGDNSWAIST